MHLNPKVGCGWMNGGKQKEVVTPGNNAKRHLCGALDARTGLLTWVRAERKNSLLFKRKNSLLFIALLRRLAGEAYPDAEVVHVVLDNYGIHTGKISQAAVADPGGRVVPHFLPPYCPMHNKIERVWLDLHANVTRNHTCRSMDELMREVVRYLMTRNCRTRAKLAKAG